MNKFPIFQKFGNQAILISFKPEISSSVSLKVYQMDEFLNKHFKSEIIETVPAYNSIAVYFNPKIDIEIITNKIKTDYRKEAQFTIQSSRLIEIPVCYHEDFALDLSYLANFHSLSEDEVITMHSASIYKVYFLGFLPGFPYLGKLDKKLHTPRRSKPRPLVSKGSVAIGGEQTGIYPTSSPGGWQIIGNSPLEFFYVKDLNPTLLSTNDHIRFQPIELKEFYEIEEKVKNGKYDLKITQYNG